MTLLLKVRAKAELFQSSNHILRTDSQLSSLSNEVESRVTKPETYLGGE